MIKLRIMGKVNDLLAFKKLLAEAGCFDVISESDILNNSGTQQYKRIFMDVNINDEKTGIK